MDPNLAASLLHGNNNTPTNNAPPANTAPQMSQPIVPTTNAAPQTSQPNTPQTTNQNQFPQPPNNIPTPPPSYNQTPQDPFNSWPFTNSNGGTPQDPFNSWPFTNSNTPAPFNAAPGSWPGMRPPGSHINLPGMKITEGPNGSHIKMPGMEILEGPNGSHIKMPGMEVIEGPNGSHVRMPGMEVSSGPGGDHITYSQGGFPPGAASVRSPSVHKRAGKFRWPFNNVQIGCRNSDNKGNVYGPNYGVSLGSPEYHNPRVNGSVPGMGGWMSGGGSPPKQKKGWMRS